MADIWDEKVSELLKRLTSEEKISMLATRMEAVPRLGIEEFKIGTEVARGLICRGEYGESVSTVFPEPFGMAASFDAELMYRIGEITGIETRIYSKEGKCSLCVWGPTVDLERDPRWGRTEEGYGEDPFLTGTLAAAYTLGMLGKDDKYARVIPTLKHFYANNREDNRINGNSVIPISLKEDYYLRAFEKPIKNGGAKAVMTCYNEINGVEGINNPELDKICKKQWGMLFSVTDGGDFVQNVKEHKRDKTHLDTIVKVYKNHGADIMTDNGETVKAAARKALEKGLITEEDIDSALFGVFKARFMLGEFEPVRPYNNYDSTLICCREHMDVAKKAAEESIILLKNDDNILPLKKGNSLAVIGYQAVMNFRDWYTGLSPENPVILNAIREADDKGEVSFDSGCDIINIKSPASGYCLTVNGKGILVCSENKNYMGFELYDWGCGAVSFRSKANGKFLKDDGLIKADSDEVFGWYVKELFIIEKYEDGYTIKNWQNRYLNINEDGTISACLLPRVSKNCVFNLEIISSGAERVRGLAEKSDSAVVFCGNNPMVNARECSDRKTIDLPEHQNNILDAALSVNPNTVLFFVSGYTYAFNKNKVKAALHMAHAGPVLALAASRALFGDINPAGRCPVTWYKSDRELCDIENYNIAQTRSTYLYYDGEPLFPFGHGLSYTKFNYGEFKTDKSEYSGSETIHLSLELENIGNLSGDEVVQIYIALPDELPLVKPIKMLKAFSRVYVSKGEKRVVELSVPVEELARWNINTNCRTVFNGVYKIYAGASSSDLRKHCEVKINGTEYNGIDVSLETAAVNSMNYSGVIYDANDSLSEYALLKDWQSYIAFDYCDLREYGNIEVTVSNPDAQTTLIVRTNDETIAAINVPTTGGFGEFITIKSPAKPVSGIKSVIFITGGTLSFKSFRFSHKR